MSLVPRNWNVVRPVDYNARRVKPVDIWIAAPREGRMGLCKYIPIERFVCVCLCLIYDAYFVRFSIICAIVYMHISCFSRLFLSCCLRCLYHMYASRVWSRWSGACFCSLLRCFKSFTSSIHMSCQAIRICSVYRKCTHVYIYIPTGRRTARSVSFLAPAFLSAFSSSRLVLL